jgi:hypothetical protein
MIMRSQALVELVQKIFHDESAKAQFIADPDRVLSQYTLTEEEKRAVLTTHYQFGLVTGDSPEMAAAIEKTGWNAPVP